MAELVQNIKQGSDSLSANIVSDGCNQLSKLTTEIFTLLKEITAFSGNCINRISASGSFSSFQSPGKPQAKQWKKLLPKSNAPSPTNCPICLFFPSWLMNWWRKSSPPQRNKLKQELINSLRIKEKKKTSRKEVSHKPLLMEAARILSGASIHMEKAIAKLNESQQLLDQRRLSLGERFRRWVMNAIQKKSEKHVYMVEFFDEKTGATRMVRIDYDAFADNVRKRARILNMLASKGSSAYMRLEGSDEEKVYEYVSNIVDELHKILTTLPALDTYFKTEAPRELRTTIRGIKIEISAIKKRCHPVKSEAPRIYSQERRNRAA